MTSRKIGKEYIYIYIKREREREGGRGVGGGDISVMRKEREGATGHEVLPGFGLQ